MRNSIKALALSTVFGLLATSNAYAIFVAPTSPSNNINTSPGFTYITTGMSSFTVGGAPFSDPAGGTDYPNWVDAVMGMNGIKVTAYYLDGSNSGALTWTATGGLNSDPGVSVAGTQGWSLTEWGNTIGDILDPAVDGPFSYAGNVGDPATRPGPGVWGLTTAATLTNLITKIVINLQPGDRSFDINPKGPGCNPGQAGYPACTPTGSRANPVDYSIGGDVTPGSAEGNAFGNLQSNNDANGTPGVADGLDCGFTAGTACPQPYRASEQPPGQTEPDYNYSVLYTNKLGIDPDGPGVGVAATFYGDEYTQLEITFSPFIGTAPNPGGVGGGSNFYFLADTDAATTTIIPQVPEPMTLALFGTGLVGIGALRRRRKAAK